MFSYFGSKSKIVGLYPRPKFDTIIEPFAGSARYSLYDDNWRRNIILVDLDPKIIEIWRYLQGATAADIMDLPNVLPHQDIRELSFPCAGARNLVFACCARGSATFGNKTGGFNSWYTRDRIRVSKSVHKIKHWDIRIGSYTDIENRAATWFIDPPYQALGYRYTKHSIDYPILLDWCKKLKGQTIICENSDSNWLPSPCPVKMMRGNKHTKQEIMQIFESNAR